MPNRIIKESIRTSKTVNSLSDFEFRLWAYLITYVDDYGRGSADSAIIKGFVFPLRKTVTEKSIDEAMKHLECIGLINLYEVDGELYLCFPKWENHQRVQNKKSKFPEPPIEEEAQIHGESRYVTVNHGESPSESNPNPNTNPNPKKILFAQTENGSAQYADVETIVLNDGSEWKPTVTEYAEYGRLYPNVDVQQEFRKMHGWCNANPAKRKTQRGVKRFVNSWLSREQDRYKPNAPMQRKNADMSVFDEWRVKD